MLNSRAVCQTKAKFIGRANHDAKVITPVPAVSFNLAVSHIHTRESRGIHTHTEFSLSILNRNTGADADEIAHLVSNARVHVKGVNLGRGTAVGMLPIAVIFRTHTEGHRHGKTQPHLVVDLVGHVTSRNHLAFQTTVFRFTVIAFEISIQTDPNAAGLKTRAVEQRHTGRVVVHSRQIVTDDTGAGIGTAGTQRGLFR